MKRLGAVITFKPGVSRKKVADALKRITDVLHMPDKTYDFVKVGENPVPSGKQDVVKMVERDFRVDDLLKEFDDERGNPVFYIP